MVFLPEPISWLEQASGYARLLASLGIAYFGKRHSDGPRRARTVGVTLTGLLFILVGASLLTGAPSFALASNILFNVSFTAASWIAATSLIQGGGGLRREMLSFTVYTTIAYAVIAAANAWVYIRPPTGDLLSANVFAQGAFVIIWSVIVGAVFLRRAQRAASDDAAVPQTFVHDYRITNREAEIIDELANGATSKRIGEKLFISQRTVETHIHNIYRKCGVANRVELLALVKRYHGR
jgi:DNA-binding CsgD family transcriptional regulator